MPGMTDPSSALQSFQIAMVSGQLSLQRGALDHDVFLHFDQPNNRPRFTYVRVEGSTVTAMAMFVADVPMDGKPFFDLGYAVPAAYRGQGRAKEIVAAGLAELAKGMGRTRAPSLFVQAVVGKDNAASQHVAVATISAEPTEIIDSVSGLPALRYFHEFSTT